MKSVHYLTELRFGYLSRILSFTYMPRLTERPSLGFISIIFVLHLVLVLVLVSVRCDSSEGCFIIILGTSEDCDRN